MDRATVQSVRESNRYGYLMPYGNPEPERTERQCIPDFYVSSRYNSLKKVLISVIGDASARYGYYAPPNRRQGRNRVRERQSVPLGRSRIVGATYKTRLPIPPLDESSSDEYEQVYESPQLQATTSVPVYDLEETSEYADNEDNEEKFYSFEVPSGIDPASGGKTESGLGSSVEVDIEHTVDEREIPPTGSNDCALPVHHVIESQYVGDGYAYGEHKVRLVSVLSGRASVPKSQFRWMYDSYLSGAE